IVKKTKDVVDDLREQISKIEAKLKSLDQASLDFGENKPYIAGKSDSDEVQEKKDSYKTKSGEVIPYQSALNFGAETGPDKVRGKGDTPRDTPHLRPLKEGEFATVERKYTVDKNYSFSGNNKIESHGDVAFIFRQLETASVENAFAVYVDKNGKAVIQHMSMGHFSGTVVDAKLIIDGVKRFKAAKVYFVHNHPSGNLKPSIPDRDVLRKLKAAAPHLNVEAVIININTGEYSTFDVITNSDIHPRETDQWGDKVKKKYTTLKFDKQVFKDNVKPFSKISKSQDVAAFISAQRLSVGNKGSLLVLDRGNNIKAKIELGAAPFSEAQADEIASYVIRFGGEAAILFGRYGDIIDQNVKVFKKVLADKEITLLDVIDIGSKPIIDVAGYEGYKSIADAGMLGEKKPAYPATQTDTPEFKKWFKDSQIVAKDGKPLVVYHGTDADFNVFASTNPNLTVGGKLSYFTTSTDIAEQYSGKEGSIMPVYLSIKNPKRLDYKGNGWFNIGTDAETAKKEGYDGLIVNNVAGHGDTEYIAFSPTQIKSATGNVGTFDVKNPDILQEKKPEYQMSDDEIIDNIASLAQKRDGLRRVKKLYSNARQFFQDRNLPIKEMQDAAWKTGGIKTDENQPFEKKNRSISRMQRLHELFQKDLMVPYVKAISTVQKIKGIDWNMIVEYKIAKHAPERNERLRGEKLKEWQLSHKEATEEDIEAKIFELSLRDFSGVGALDKTPKLEYSNRADELAAKIVKSFESKVPKKLIEDLWVKTKATTSFTVDQWKESGAITQERADEIKDMYNNYVPLRGWLEAAAKILKYHKRGSGDVRMPKTKGRTSLPDNPIAYIEQMAFNAIRDRVQNEVAESLLEFVMDNPNKDLYEVKEIYYIKTGEGDAADAWTMTLFRPDKKMFEEGNARTAIYAGHERLRTPAQAKQHEVIVHLKGNDIAIVMKDEMLPVAQAMNNQNSLVKIGGEDLDIESVNKFFGGTLGRITNLQKQLMTSLNITFMATNFPRDVGEAALTTLVLSGPKQTADFLAYLPIAFKTIATDIYMPKKFDPVNNIEHKRYDDFRLMGGPTGFVHHRTIEQLHKNLQKQIKNEMRGFNVNAAKARTQLENINKLFEDATRFSIYVSAIKAGKTPGEAATEAKEASVNFDTKGKSTKSFDAVIAFWNPAMQSLEKNPRLARKYPKAFASVSLAVMLVGYFMAELSRLLDDDDQDHYNINTWMRHNYLTFPKGNGEYMSIPLPQFWRGFYSWGVITSDIIHGEMTLEDGVASGLLNFIAGLSPVDLGGFYVDGEFSWAPVWPTAIKPFLELQANQNYFGGQIYREVMNKALLDSKLYKRNVNPAAKFFSESLLNTYHPFPESAIKFYENEDGEQVKVPSWTDINPSKIEHLYTGYTAGTGKAIGEIVGMVYTISNPEEKLVLEHLPLINKFIRKIPEKSWKKIGEYYDLKEEVDNNRALFREATNPKNKDKKLSDPFIYKTERKRNMESIVYGDSGVEALINDLEKDLERGDITFDEFNEQKSDIMLKAVEDYKEIK
nr:hypothetical protein [Thiomicrorhabdus sp.]